MSDSRIRHGIDLRASAAELLDRGLGRKSVADRVGVPEETVRQWQLTYRAVGLEGLLVMGRKQAVYDHGTRVAAARAVVEYGMTRAEAMSRFGVASQAPLDRWCRLCREGGAAALEPKPRGRPGAAPAPRTRERELEERVRKLEAQVAYLKNSVPWPRGARADRGEGRVRQAAPG